MSEIGPRLKAARESARFTQQDAADELGVTKGALSAWENDKNFPQLQMFMDLCRLYGASADAILFGAPAQRLARVADGRAEYAGADHRRLVELVDTLSDRQRRGLLDLLSK